MAWRTYSTTYDESRRVASVGDGVNDRFGDRGKPWVRETLDTNAGGTIEKSRIFVHDAGQIVLDFETPARI